MTIFPKGKTRHHVGLPQATCLSPAPNPAHGAGPCLPPFYTAHRADPRCWPEPCLSHMQGPRPSPAKPHVGLASFLTFPPTRLASLLAQILPAPAPAQLASLLAQTPFLLPPRGGIAAHPPHVPLRPTRGARPTFWAKMGNCPVCSCQLMIHWQEQTGQMPIFAKKRSSQLGHGLKRDCPGQNGPYGHLRNED